MPSYRMLGVLVPCCVQYTREVVVVLWWDENGQVWAGTRLHAHIHERKRKEIRSGIHEHATSRQGEK